MVATADLIQNTVLLRQGAIRGLRVVFTYARRRPRDQLGRVSNHSRSDSDHRDQT